MYLSIDFAYLKHRFSHLGTHCQIFSRNLYNYSELDVSDQYINFYIPTECVSYILNPQKWNYNRAVENVNFEFLGWQKRSSHTTEPFYSQ